MKEVEVYYSSLSLKTKETFTSRELLVFNQAFECIKNIVEVHANSSKNRMNELFSLKYILGCLDLRVSEYENIIIVMSSDYYHAKIEDKFKNNILKKYQL